MERRFRHFFTRQDRLSPTAETICRQKRDNLSSCSQNRQKHVRTKGL